MNQPMITRKIVKNNKELKAAQKYARKLYGRTHGKTVKAKLNKVVLLENTEFVSYSCAQEFDTKENIPLDLDFKTLVSCIDQSKLTGLSGNGFSTSFKLNTFANTKTNRKFLIVNAVECDPGLVHDDCILRNRIHYVNLGIQILKKCFDFEAVYLATKEKTENIQTEAIVKQVPNRYPMGQEKILIEYILNRSMNKDEIPTEHGILVLNIQTVMEIAKLICFKNQFENRYLTIANLRNGEAKVVLADFGMNIKKLFYTAFPDIQDTNIYTGGGAMSVHPAGENEVVEATTNFIAVGELPDFDLSTPCKGCGKCIMNCPMGVQVNKIMQAVERNDREQLQKYHPENCIGCGACTYVCRAGKNTQQIISLINQR